ncbi:bile acid:sodium symporter family protein [Corynebacterium sp. TA-R-1]|uniref:Bile acid:sodium symporter family protein n=1 Tax=Corynebacterium stercoris TaxID=2943490 RepID=A0ABT1FZ71_9CORY|nr:bile acid:sodium symporter family protein [Corynebacterium stercoris]MCP1387051.1 bile acid:sodium symporter family protein [Corynebacterium stercoris]
MTTANTQHAGGAPVEPEFTAQKDRSAAIAVAAFPAFILAGAALAFFFPAPFLPLTQYITYFLMIIMFGMGLTLTIPDFKEVARRPVPVLIGVVAQFVVMPLSAVLVAKIFGLNPALAVGLLMLGSVPGGTSSNVIAYLSKGDVALSVAMTSVSTLVAPIMTPILMLLLAGANVEVNAAGMAKSLAQTILIPVIGGLVLRYLLDSWMEKISPVLPWISIIGIGGVVFPTVAKNREALIEVGLIVFLAVLAHNVLGYLLGYYAAKFTGQPESYRRTVAIEVGTQSAGLSSGMAGKFFSPEAALPGAVAAVLHNITGAVYAWLVRTHPTEKDIAAGEDDAARAADPAEVPAAS